MRRVERIHRAPEVLTQPFQRGSKANLTERAAAIRAFRKGGRTWATFKFTRYSEVEVRAALVRLFHGKCAYCESYFAATQPIDVEHYRPKGQVQEDATHPGYYWLAADWENLLPSCIDCNRPRTQHDRRAASSGVLGKHDQFPIAGVRATQPCDDRDLEREQLDEEQPLLLNPCVDDPDEYLTYDDAFVVWRHASGPKQQRAEKSIEVYGLNRSDLVQARMEVQRQVRFRIDMIDRITTIRDDPQLQGEHHEQVRWALDDLIDSLCRSLVQMTKPDQPYSSFARFLVRSFAPNPDMI